MKKLNIEWKHLDLDKGTCLRCLETDKTLQQVILELKEELKDVKITFIETKLSEKKIHQSNVILINGKPIEKILSNTEVSKNYCQSCSCLTGNENYCRTIQYNDKGYKEIPEELIRMAVLKILNIKEKVIKK